MKSAGHRGGHVTVGKCPDVMQSSDRQREMNMSTKRPPSSRCPSAQSYMAHPLYRCESDHNTQERPPSRPPSGRKSGATSRTSHRGGEHTDTPCRPSSSLNRYSTLPPIKSPTNDHHSPKSLSPVPTSSSNDSGIQEPPNDNPYTKIRPVESDTENKLFLESYNKNSDRNLEFLNSRAPSAHSDPRQNDTKKLTENPHSENADSLHSGLKNPSNSQSDKTRQDSKYSKNTNKKLKNSTEGDVVIPGDEVQTNDEHLSTIVRFTVQNENKNQQLKSKGDSSQNRETRRYDGFLSPTESFSEQNENIVSNSGSDTGRSIFRSSRTTRSIKPQNGKIAANLPGDTSQNLESLTDYVSGDELEILSSNNNCNYLQNLIDNDYDKIAELSQDVDKLEITNNDQISICLKLPNGDRLEISINKSSSLKSLQDIAEARCKTSLDGYDFVTDFPRNVFKDKSMSLEKCGINDRSVVYMDQD